jgi:hypothetical protein
MPLFSVDDQTPDVSSVSRTGGADAEKRNL